MIGAGKDYLFLVPGRVGLSVEAEKALPGPNILERGMSAKQLPMNFMARGEDSATSHITNESSFLAWPFNRSSALFDALQDDWLRPATRNRPPVRIRSFAEDVFESSDHRILVRLKFDPERLPRIPICHRRGNKWLVDKIDPHRTVAGEAVFWPGASRRLLFQSAGCIHRGASATCWSCKSSLHVPLPAEPRVLRSGEDVTLGEKRYPAKH